MKFIINIDGGSRGNPGPGASGVVIKDASLAVVLARGYFLGDCTNNFAEFTALKIALEEAKKLGGSELSIFSDSLLLVKQYLGEYKIKHEVLKELMGQIKVLSAHFKRINIKHVLRDKNKEADAMANEAMDIALKVKKSPHAKPSIIKVEVATAKEDVAKPNTFKTNIIRPTIKTSSAKSPVSKANAKTQNKEKDCEKQLELF